MEWTTSYGWFKWDAWLLLNLNQQSSFFFFIYIHVMYFEAQVLAVKRREGKGRTLSLSKPTSTR